MSRRVAGLWALVLILALLGVGTINNQLRINKANAVLSRQAADGAANLARTCKLSAISKKAYTDMLRRDVITLEDFALFSDTLQEICTRR